jgi:hypothetical protein
MTRLRLFRAAPSLGASTESELVLAPTAIPGLASMCRRGGGRSVTSMNTTGAEALLRKEEDDLGRSVGPLLARC